MVQVINKMEGFVCFILEVAQLCSLGLPQTPYLLVYAGTTGMNYHSYLVWVLFYCFPKENIYICAEPQMVNR